MSKLARVVLIRTRRLHKGVLGGIIFVIAALVAGVAASGQKVVFLGDMLEETIFVERQDIASVTVQLDMIAGEMTVHGGTNAAVKATLRTTYKGDRPNSDYEVNGDLGVLLITQPEPESLVLLGGHRRNEWDVQLGKAVPVDVTIQLQDSTLNADLRQAWQHNLSITIHAASSDVTVYLPRQIGVQITVDPATSKIKTSGLRRDGNVFTNTAFGTSDVTLILMISRTGSGVIDLRAE